MKGCWGLIFLLFWRSLHKLIFHEIWKCNSNLKIINFWREDTSKHQAIIPRLRTTIISETIAWHHLEPEVKGSIILPRYYGCVYYFACAILKGLIKEGWKKTLPGPEWTAAFCANNPTKQIPHQNRSRSAPRLHQSLSSSPNPAGQLSSLSRLRAEHYRAVRRNNAARIIKCCQISPGKILM